jgi:hypothetical protein
VQNWYDGAIEKLVQNKKLTTTPVVGPLISLLDTNPEEETVEVPYDFIDYKEKPIKGEQNMVKQIWIAKRSKDLAKLTFSPKTKTLKLKNFDVALARKILLLGFSSKTKKDYLVGQFGEGLKVGILAMIREKKTVTMKTGDEIWTFCLLEDHNFSEQVLSVVMEPIPKPIVNDLQEPTLATLSQYQTTCTTICNVSIEEWDTFSRDFLFLRKPKEWVETNIGYLILDPLYKHKLFVKGFWIADLKDDGLLFGVNLKKMELDRDRRAVVKRHDIENQVSDIWSKSIVKRQDLVPVFFDLLMQDHQVSFLFISISIR